MARWTVTIQGKGIRKASVDALAQKLKDKYGEEAFVTVTDASPPESRADRFSAAQSLVSDARSEAESLRDELTEWKDNMPENLQSGSKAEKLDTAVDELESFIASCEEAEGFSVDFPGMH